MSADKLSEDKKKKESRVGLRSQGPCVADTPLIQGWCTELGVSAAAASFHHLPPVFPTRTIIKLNEIAKVRWFAIFSRETTFSGTLILSGEIADEVVLCLYENKQ